MGILSSLNRSQKEAIGLLQVGTFLEYFDFMLYVHMAVLLNELFFPKTDPHTAAVLTALAFCSSYVLRPFGALIFGYIGDNIGRKTTVIITTMMMSISCIVMANVPTYAEIGISAAWIVTTCRLVQGMSSMGEIMGAMVYITEITKPPVQYPSVSFLCFASSLGGVAALGIAALVTRSGFNWRIAFWIGAGIAVIGSIARTKLRETPEFVDMKRKLQKDLEESLSRKEQKYYNLKNLIERYRKEKIDPRTLLSGFLIQCGWPVTFYLGFMYFNQFLKAEFSYSSEDIILHNFFLSIVMFFSYFFWGILSFRTHPLKILKFRARIFGIFFLFLPFLLQQTSHQYQVFAMQSFLFIVFLGADPAYSIIIKAMPVFKRFTATSVSYALARALVFIITSFGFVYLSEIFGHYGAWIIVVPLTIGFLCGVNHFEKLESKNPHKVHTPLSTNPNEIKLAG